MLRICSLISTEPQVVQPGTWRVVRFPFGAAESSDEWEMHQAARLDPPEYVITDWRNDDRSGLIWPSAWGWGSITVNIRWETGKFTQLLDEIIRDPFGYTSDPMNVTGADHRPPTVGTTPFTKHHEIFVYPNVPLAIRISHNDIVPRAITHAQFKLAINTAVERPVAGGQSLWLAGGDRDHETRRSVEVGKEGIEPEFRPAPDTEDPDFDRTRTQDGPDVSEIGPTDPEDGESGQPATTRR